MKSIGMNRLSRGMQTSSWARRMGAGVTRTCSCISGFHERRLAAGTKRRSPPATTLEYHEIYRGRCLRIQ
jgi:hypothetical protein